MDNVSQYRAPAPITVETVQHGELVTLELDGDITPSDALEASICADLAAAGVLTPATPSKGKKTTAPPEES